MSKIRRGGYIFVTWKGDHSPRHVHVYRDGTLIVKWDLDGKKPIDRERHATSSRVNRATGI